MENRAAFEEYVNGTIGKLSDEDKLELTRLLDEVSRHIADWSARRVRARRIRARGAGVVKQLLLTYLRPYRKRISLIVMLVLASVDRQPVPAYSQRRHHQQRRGQGRHRLHPPHRPHHAGRALADHRLLGHVGVQRLEDRHGGRDAT